MFWMILSWVFVALLTGINIFVFIKMKKAAEQMMQMAFPGVRNMGEAMSKMQQMMGGMGQMGNKMGNRGGMPGNNAGFEAQMKTAMNLLQNMQKKK